MIVPSLRSCSQACAPCKLCVGVPAVGSAPRPHARAQATSTERGQRGLPRRLIGAANCCQQIESFEVKAVAWDEFLGGHDFDVKLAGVFGKQFDEKNQVTPTRLCFCVLLLQQ